MQRSFKTFMEERGSAIIMWLLIAVTLLSPIADAHPRVGATLILPVLFSVLAGASFAGNKRIIVAVALPITGLWMIARLMEELSNGHHFYDGLSHFVGLGLSCAILWALFDRLGGVSELTSSVIAQAFITYIIIAIAFSQLYWIVNEISPHAFNPAILTTQSSALLYFSMITLSSVGYGDVVPVNPFVRLIAALESMTGVFFIAVVVARLVAAYRPHAFPTSLKAARRKGPADSSLGGGPVSSMAEVVRVGQVPEDAAPALEHIDVALIFLQHFAVR
jgi:hypothetical protein